MFVNAVGLDDNVGNMIVTAPSAATAGETATINVQWNGLSSGPASRQLGVVSHSDANGLQDLTVIGFSNNDGFALCDIDLPDVADLPSCQP